MEWGIPVFPTSCTAYLLASSDPYLGPSFVRPCANQRTYLFLPSFLHDLVALVYRGNPDFSKEKALFLDLPHPSCSIEGEQALYMSELSSFGAYCRY